jgi:hypothetical protein
MSLRFKAPFFTWRYRSETWQPGRFAATQGANDSVNCTIHLVGCISGIATILPGHFLYEIQFLHLPGG